jgi:hypothetical protein
MSEPNDQNAFMIFSKIFSNHAGSPKLMLV